MTSSLEIKLQVFQISHLGVICFWISYIFPACKRRRADGSVFPGYPLLWSICLWLLNLKRAQSWCLKPHLPNSFTEALLFSQHNTFFVVSYHICLVVFHLDQRQKALYHRNLCHKNLVLFAGLYACKSILFHSHELYDIICYECALSLL